MTTTAPPAVPEASAAGELKFLKLSELKPAVDNVRADVGDVAELAQSIKALGLLEPLIATRTNGHYTIVAGARRFAGATLAGLDVVPVMVRDFTEQQRIEAMLVENLQRKDISPLEEARAYRRLIDECGISQRDLADRVGRSQGHISKRVQLLDLPAKVLKELDSGGITIGGALQFVQLKNMPKRLDEAFRQVTKYNWEPEQAVSEQLREHELEQKIAKETEKLQADGVKVVKYVKNGYYESLPTGVVRLGGYDFVKVSKLTPAAHAAHPCHAAAIDEDGDVVYLCTNVANHRTGAKVDSKVAASEKEQRAKELATERAQTLRARENNIELGRTLEQRLAAPAIDVENMRLLADLLVMHDGDGIAQCGFRYTDDDSQTVITRKDGTVSRIVHVDHNRAKELLVDRLEEAKTPEQIMGVLLQALIAARYANTNAVPQSQRWGAARGISSVWGGANPLRVTVEKLAGKHGIVSKKPAKPRAKAAA